MKIEELVEPVENDMKNPMHGEENKEETNEKVSEHLEPIDDELKMKESIVGT